MKIINFYGQPGAGKSTLAASLYAQMKKSGYNVQLLTQYAKDCVYQDRLFTVKDQLYLLSKQNHKLLTYQNKHVEYVITDSPLLLCGIYCYISNTNHLPIKEFKELAYAINKSYTNINFFVERGNDIQYQNNGRFQNSEEAKKIKKQLLNYLNNELKEEYQIILNTKNISINNILKRIKELNNDNI